MRPALTLLMGVATLLAMVSAIDVPVATRYLTTEVNTLKQSQTVLLVGYLCNLAKGESINVTMVLNNNPEWNVNKGVIYYYVVDLPIKTEKDALCTNMYQGNPGPFCVVGSWPSDGNLYIVGNANPVEAISFTVDAEKFNKVDPRKPAIDQQAVEPLPRRLPGQRPLRGANSDLNITLTEFVTVTTSHALPRLQEAHLNFSFCDTPATGTQYTITATVAGTDYRSSWTLYLCNKTPCELSQTGNIVAENGKQLPSNTAVTNGGNWKQMYALIICWGGPFDPKTGTYIGNFQFSAYATKSG